MRYLAIVNDLKMSKLLIARFAKIIGLYVFRIRSIQYVEGEVPLGEDIYIVVLLPQNPIQFYANIERMQIIDKIFDAKHYVNYAHLTDIDISCITEPDWESVAKAFPKLRKIKCLYQKSLQNALKYMPNLKYAHVNELAEHNPAFYAQYRHIRFYFKAVDTYVINEPNVMFIIETNICEINKFYPIRKKIIALRYRTQDHDGSNIEFIPDCFSEITNLMIYNPSKKDIYIIGFLNLDTIELSSDSNLFIKDAPFIKKIYGNKIKVNFIK